MSDGGVADPHWRNTILSFKLPQAPLGADAIEGVSLVLTVRKKGTSANRIYYANKLTSLWTEGGVTWSAYDGATGWNKAGGDYTDQVGSGTISGSAGSSFSIDISSMGLDWGKRGTVEIIDSAFNGPFPGATDSSYMFYSLDSGTGTNAYLPHIHRTRKRV